MLSARTGGAFRGGEREVRFQQRVEAEEVVGARDRDVRRGELRIPLDGVLEVVERRPPSALETGLPQVHARLNAW